jgi:hypothetical protein
MRRARVTRGDGGACLLDRVDRGPIRRFDGDRRRQASARRDRRQHEARYVRTPRSARAQRPANVSPTSVRSLRPTIRSPYTSRPACAPAHRGVRTAADSPESIYAWTALPPVHLDASAPNQPLYCRPRRRSFLGENSGARTGPAAGRAGPHPSVHATKTWRTRVEPGRVPRPAEPDRTRPSTPRRRGEVRVPLAALDRPDLPRATGGL